MKKILYILGVMLAVASCTKDEEIGYATPTTDGYVDFTAGSPTRVSADGLTWEADDPIGVTTYDGVDYTHNLSYKIGNASTGAMEAVGNDANIIADGECTYIAYSPRTTTEYDDGVIKCDLTTSQEPLLTAKTTSSDESVTLQFAHKYAQLTFVFKGHGESNNLSNATAQLTGAYTKGQHSLLSGNWGALSSEPLDITITNGEATIYILPQFPNDNDVEIVITLGEDEYTTPITTNQWKAGESYKYNILVGQQDNRDDFTDNYFDISNSIFTASATPAPTTDVVFSDVTDVTYNTTVLPNGSNIIDISSSHDLNSYFENYIIGIEGVDGYYTINTNDLTITESGGTYSTQIILNYGSELSTNHTLTLQGTLSDSTITVVGEYDVVKKDVAGSDLCVNLTWTDTGSPIMDLDILLYEPASNNWIYFGNTNQATDYGLDNDSWKTGSPNENIVVPDREIESGYYIVGIWLWDNEGITQRVDYVVTATYKGKLIELEDVQEYPNATNPYMGYYDGNSNYIYGSSISTVEDAATKLFRFKIKD